MNDPNTPSEPRASALSDPAASAPGDRGTGAAGDTDRDGYIHFSRITTRWSDNDVYGHVNNAVYYQFFDTVANAYLIERGGLDIHAAETVAFIVASSCRYHAPIRHPAEIDAGFRVNRIGRSSVEYGIAVFESGTAAAAANGTFTHVFVDRAGGQSVPIPPPVRAALEAARFPAASQQAGRSS